MPDGKSTDKSKDIEILLEKDDLLRLSKEVMQMAENDSELLNSVYKEISEKLGMDNLLSKHREFPWGNRTHGRLSQPCNHYSEDTLR